MKKVKYKIVTIITIMYILIIMAFFIGKKLAESVGLEYRYWVEFLFYMIAWFVPVVLVNSTPAVSLHHRNAILLPPCHSPKSTKNWYKFGIKIPF